MQRNVATIVHIGSGQRRGSAHGIEDRVCHGTVVVACISMDTYRGIPIPDKYRALFEQHVEEAAPS